MSVLMEMYWFPSHSFLMLSTLDSCWLKLVRSWLHNSTQLHYDYYISCIFYWVNKINLKILKCGFIQVLNETWTSLYFLWKKIPFIYIFHFVLEFLCSDIKCSKHERWEMCFERKKTLNVEYQKRTFYHR